MAKIHRTKNKEPILIDEDILKGFTMKVKCSNCNGDGCFIEKKYDPDDEIIHECEICDGEGYTDGLQKSKN